MNSGINADQVWELLVKFFRYNELNEKKIMEETCIEYPPKLLCGLQENAVCFSDVTLSSNSMSDGLWSIMPQWALVVTAIAAVIIAAHIPKKVSNIERQEQKRRDREKADSCVASILFELSVAKANTQGFLDRLYPARAAAKNSPEHATQICPKPNLITIELFLLNALAYTRSYAWIQFVPNDVTWEVFGAITPFEVAGNICGSIRKIESEVVMLSEIQAAIDIAEGSQARISKAIEVLRNYRGGNQSVPQVESTVP